MHGRATLLLISCSLSLTGCTLARSAIGGAMNVDAGPFDVGPRDGGSDAPMDDTGLDGGSDAGSDGGSDAGTDGGHDAWVPVCTPGATQCEADGLSTCVAPGVWGADVACGLGCLGSVTPQRCGLIDASNVDDTMFFASTMDFAVPGDTTFDTTGCVTGSMMVGGFTIPTTSLAQTSGPNLCIVSMRALDVSGHLHVHGTQALVLLATRAVTVSGTIDVSAVGGIPGSGGAAASAARSGGNGGHNGYSDGGGGGGALGGGGGVGGQGGGDVIATFGGAAPGGSGGSAVATFLLSPLLGGAGGGIGGTGATPGLGGGGGGALQISSWTSIHVSGRIIASGGGGGGGGNGVASDTNIGAGGGGGSGGGILLEAPTVMIDGTLAANGGGGGGGGGCGASGVSGEDGHADGTVAAGGAHGGPCSGTIYSAAGGSGSVAATLGAMPGTSLSGTGDNGGGGGGGAGIIVLRARVHAAGGTFSPSGTPAFSRIDVDMR